MRFIWIRKSEFGILKPYDWRKEEGKYWLTVWLAMRKRHISKHWVPPNQSTSELQIPISIFKWNALNVKWFYIYIYFIYGVFLTPWNLKHKKWPKFNLFRKIIQVITFGVTKDTMCKILHLNFDFDNINRYNGIIFSKSKMATNP